MQAGVGGGMKAGINIWRALRDIKDVHPAWACVAERRYTEADLPRPITRKEDVGTLTGTKEFDESQVCGGSVHHLVCTTQVYDCACAAMLTFLNQAATVRLCMCSICNEAYAVRPSQPIR